MAENIEIGVVVADASVVMSSLLDDETGSRELEESLRMVSKGLTKVVAPTLLKLEVANALCWAVKKKRCGWKVALGQYKIFMKYPIEYTEVTEVDEVMLMAKKFDLTSYDALYLWLAKKKTANLLSLDKRLINAYKLIYK